MRLNRWTVLQARRPGEEPGPPCVTDDGPWQAGTFSSSSSPWGMTLVGFRFASRLSAWVRLPREFSFTVHISSVALQFFEVIVLPLFEEFEEAFPRIRELVTGARSNYKQWRQMHGPLVSGSFEAANVNLVSRLSFIRRQRRSLHVNQSSSSQGAIPRSLQGLPTKDANNNGKAECLVPVAAWDK